jgi:hypothetical protein
MDLRLSPELRNKEWIIDAERARTGIPAQTIQHRKLQNNKGGKQRLGGHCHPLNEAQHLLGSTEFADVKTYPSLRTIPSRDDPVLHRHGLCRGQSDVAHNRGLGGCGNHDHAVIPREKSTWIEYPESPRGTKPHG